MTTKKLTHVDCSSLLQDMFKYNLKLSYTLTEVTPRKLPHLKGIMGIVVKKGKCSVCLLGNSLRNEIAANTCHFDKFLSRL